MTTHGHKRENCIEKACILDLAVSNTDIWRRTGVISSIHMRNFLGYVGVTVLRSTVLKSAMCYILYAGLAIFHVDRLLIKMYRYMPWRLLLIFEHCQYVYYCVIGWSNGTLEHDFYWYVAIYYQKGTVNIDLVVGTQTIGSLIFLVQI